MSHESFFFVGAAAIRCCVLLDRFFLLVLFSPPKKIAIEMRRLASRSTLCSALGSYARCCSQNKTTEVHSESGSDVTPAPDADSWFIRHLDAALNSGKITKESYDYFCQNRRATPEVISTIEESFRVVGDADPKRYTQYQRREVSERISYFGARTMSSSCQELMKEQNETQNFLKDGTPTGEHYWLEDRGLADPSVPNYIKDDVLADMRKSRRRESSAFVQPEPGKDFKPEEEPESLKQERRIRFRPLF